jgi:hypothetical protein
VNGIVEESHRVAQDASDHFCDNQA